MEQASSIIYKLETDRRQSIHPVLCDAVLVRTKEKGKEMTAILLTATCAETMDQAGIG